MARPEKRRIDAGQQSTGAPKPTGRTNAKAAGTASKGPASSQGPAASSRYTPPSPAAYQAPSPLWVPILMFSLLGIGLVTIVLNYAEILPGSSSGWYLLGGLGAILAGIITATQLR